MPKFPIAFQVNKHFTGGLIEVEAADVDEAEKQVEQMDIGELIERTGSTDWSVDAWHHQPDVDHGS